MKTKSAVFRTDASHEIGSGHVMRCLTLADELRRWGIESRFVCREHPGHLNEVIRRRGYTVHGLPCGLHGFGSRADLHQTAHAAWLGTSWNQDVDETLAVVGDTPSDWLVVDHYAIDYRWESAIRSRCDRLLVIDDLADRIHDCDLLLDQNLVADWWCRYANLVPENCAMLLGPDYALLHPRYGDLRDRVPSRESPVRRILIYFGGGDSENLTGTAVLAFYALGRSDIVLDVVINPDGLHADEVRKATAGVTNVYLHERLSSLAPLMVRADLAIGASGATSWERCCLGLPSIVITLAENQKPIAAELDRRGVVHWLGHVGNVGKRELTEAIDKYVKDGLDPGWSARCRETVTGRGTAHVCAALRLNPKNTEVLARPAIARDERLAARPQHVETAGERDISVFRQQLRDPDNCHLFVVETDNGLPLGLVRFERTDEAWRSESVLNKLAEIHGLAERCRVAALLALRKAIDDRSPFVIAEELTLGGAEPGLRDRLSISICSDSGSWINATVASLIFSWSASGHRVTWTHSAECLPGGDLCFFLSYGRIVGPEIRSRYGNCLVVHASDLPKGRGWSPASWLVLEGVDRIPATLFEAVDDVDAGQVYLQEWIALDGLELVDGWRGKLADATAALAAKFVDRYPGILASARQQSGIPSFYSRRKAENSELDATKSIAEQFDLLRIVDNESYPAFFEYKGRIFVLKVYPKAD